jgi:hypothetical protein
MNLPTIRKKFKTRRVKFARPVTGYECGIHVTAPDFASISEALGRAIRNGFTTIYIHKTKETAV